MLEVVVYSKSTLSPATNWIPSSSSEKTVETSMMRERPGMEGSAHGRVDCIGDDDSDLSECADVATADGVSGFLKVRTCEPSLE